MRIAKGRIVKQGILPKYTPRYTPNGHEVAIISTDIGKIRIMLDGVNAPITVGNFIELAKRGFYSMIRFHAYKEGAVLVGGCQGTRHLTQAQMYTGTHGCSCGLNPGVRDARYIIKDEFYNKPNNHHKLGTISLMRKSSPNFGSSQFFFSLGRQPDFDDRFTVFGSVVDGIDVLLKLRIGDAITHVEIEGADEVALNESISRRTPTPEDLLRPRLGIQSKSGVHAISA